MLAHFVGREHRSAERLREDPKCVNHISRRASRDREPVVRASWLNIELPERERRALDSHGGHLDLFSLCRVDDELALLKFKAEAVASGLGVSLLQAPVLTEGVLHGALTRPAASDVSPLLLGALALVLEQLEDALQAPPSLAPHLLWRGDIYPAQQAGLRRDGHIVPFMADVEVPIRQRVRVRAVRHVWLRSFRPLDDDFRLLDARR
eukprot:CAMPEP_0182842086 /NCGR_PEP_ID=MMETSP0006_2-20121128/25418_1 /TAXON_ID=97485 /ORGANISM="Prymnesium parvum, Strain Texoma1" /LENGTH=206 /DNA_ID=CAMNT_0024971691 /DNA_START=67 /DNA_END=683 /DNA_ORIENTATION=+